MPSASRSGYIALLLILIVSAISAATVLVLFITSLNSTLNSRDIKEGKAAKVYADACAELALQRLSDNPDPPCTTPTVICDVEIPFALGSCKIDSIFDTTGTLTDWRIRTTGSGLSNTIVKYIEITAHREPIATHDPLTGSAAIVRTWKEVDGSTW